jgi:polar amino acid transport system substrate-binding protein
MKVRDIMSSNPLTVPSTTPIKDIANIFSKVPFWSIYIVDSNRLIGIVTKNDLKFRSYGHSPKDPISDIMSKDVIQISANADIKEAIRKIDHHRINGLAVTKDGQLIGIITRYDIKNKYYPMKNLKKLTEKPPIVQQVPPPPLERIKAKLDNWADEGFEVDEIREALDSLNKKLPAKLNKKRNKPIMKKLLIIFITILAVTTMVYIYFEGSQINPFADDAMNSLIVGTSADFPPFEYIDETGTIVGFDIEMVTKILEDEGYTVEVQDIAFDSLIPSLQNGKIDVIAAAMTITEEREQQIDFSYPYYNADQSVLLKEGADIYLTASQDLQYYTVGAQIGSVGASWIQENLIDNGYMNEDDFKRYETYTLAFLDLVNGNIDAIVLDKTVAESYVKNQNVEIIMTIITNKAYGIGVKHGDAELLDKINIGLENFIESDSWDNLIMYYFKYIVY